jgi:uracil phosphoribosyltransferase
MQPYSFAEKRNPRLHIYASPVADRIKANLLTARPDPCSANAYLQQICTLLFLPLKEYLKPRTHLGQPVLIVLMRGGLLMIEPGRKSLDVKTVGLLTPSRGKHNDVPAVVYGWVPRTDSAVHYLVADVITASGRTMTACLRALEKLTQASEHSQISVVTPFLASVARDHLLSSFPDIHIHCIWHAERINADGRMIGPGFDIGDYAMGGQAGEFLR